ncbi:hypothetical protein BGX34_004963 [Mortierella sp. NVP85]|nr:hypothetical protein BGX34_004963 [Mortierella sp. NVP85]
MHLVKDLTYDMTLWQEYESILCHNLLALELFCDEGFTIDIAQYDQLRDLVIRVYRPGLRTQFPVWKPAHSMQNLLHLLLNDTDIDATATDTFWDICTRLRVLILRGISIERLPDKSMRFERLNVLELSFRSAHPLEEQLDLIIRCPKLTKLDWSEERERRSLLVLDAFVNHVANGAWPKLTRLRLEHDCPPDWDAQLAKIIQGMRQIHVLDIGGPCLGSHIFTALRPHFHILRKLDIGFDPSVTGSATPEILASCPCLEEFTMFRVMSQDIVQGRPWVCEHSMTNFVLNVIISPGQDADHHQRLILERISRLVKLEKLTLHHIPHVGESTQLGLQLGKGLEQLNTLKSLRSLKLLLYVHEVSTAEAQWMIDNWKCLKHVGIVAVEAISPNVAPMFLKFYEAQAMKLTSTSYSVEYIGSSFLSWHDHTQFYLFSMLKRVPLSSCI